jgi:3D (Asp-Asp-Asp) domain-containing protein
MEADSSGRLNIQDCLTNVMQMLRPILVALLLLAGVSCSSGPRLLSVGTRITSVKTTAYTHTEGDHIKFGKTTAAGAQLKYGRVRSAAADWSVYPVGTVFQIEGQPYLYEVDDYGSALVGTNTIDLYQPDKKAMNQWGSRRVNIKVVKWGSFSRSLHLMERKGVSKAPTYIQRMVDRIRKAVRSS